MVKKWKKANEAAVRFLLTMMNGKTHAYSKAPLAANLVRSL